MRIEHAAKKDSRVCKPSNWLWITTPEFYANKDGDDRTDLRAGSKGDWWTCAKGTRRNDLALVWRTAPRSDIGYLLRAETNAFPLHKDRFASRRGWFHGCAYRVLYKFRNPIALAKLREDPWLVTLGL